MPSQERLTEDICNISFHDIFIYNSKFYKMAAERGYTFPCYKNKVVIVTGASSGIGESTAIEFAKDGAKLAITGRNLERLNEVAKKCVAHGIPETNVLALSGDVTDDAFVKRFIKEAAEKLGGVDVWVNNAGAGDITTPGEFNKEKLDKAVKLSIGSVYSTIKYALPHLKKSKGSIINITTFVSHLFQILAAKKSGLNRTGEASEVASAIQFLASPAASYITGTEMVVDGGLTKLPFILPQDLA